MKLKAQLTRNASFESTSCVQDVGKNVDRQKMSINLLLNHRSYLVIVTLLSFFSLPADSPVFYWKQMVPRFCCFIVVHTRENLWVWKNVNNQNNGKFMISNLFFCFVALPTLIITFMLPNLWWIFVGGKWMDVIFCCCIFGWNY